MSQQISIIVAMSQNRVIGYKGGIPWHIPEDLKRFARITKGHSVIMGRKTYESILEKLGHPLKDRVNIILTSQQNYSADGCIVVNNLDTALKQAGDGEIFIIGGGQIYKSALHLATKIYVTIITGDFCGDTFFPMIKRKYWKISKKDVLKQNGFNFQFTIWERMRGFVNLHHTRTEQQKIIMEKILSDGVCPFCMENFLTYHTEPIIIDGKWWVVTNNFEPYKGTRFHFLIVYKHHITELSKISLEGGAELFTLISSLEKQYGIKGGSLFMRFGDTNRTGGTVEHLHCQLVVGETIQSNPNSSSLKVKLGYKNKNSK